MTSHHNGGRFIASLFAVVLLAVSGSGQHSAFAESKEKHLTEPDVKRFIASYPDVKKVVTEYVKDKKSDVKDAKAGLAAVIVAASDKTVRGRVDGAVKAHGFGNSKEWVQVAQSVGHAYAHIKSGGANLKAQRKLAKAIAKIEKMDLLTDEQKKKLISEVRHKGGMVLEAPPPENVAVVEPMVSEIEAVVK